MIDPGSGLDKMFIENATKKLEGFVSCPLSVVGCRTGGGGRAPGGDPVLGGTRLVFFFFSGDVSSFSAQVERGPFGSLPTSLITCALSAAFLLSSCGSLRADLGQSESGNSSLLPGTYRAGARSPNWPYRRFDRHRCPCPSKLRVALQYGREGSITEGGRTDRWPQITATPSGKFLQELMIVTNGNISM